MTDFASIRRRAEAMQERSGLGTPEHALSEDVLELLARLKQAEKLTAQDCDVAVYEARFQQEQVARKNAESERDEARELHAKACNAIGEWSSEVSRLRSNAERLLRWAKERNHRLPTKDNQAFEDIARRERDCAYPEPEPIGSIVCTSRDMDPATYVGMIDCGKCGDVHGENSACDDPDAVSQNGAFAGTVPHE